MDNSRIIFWDFENTLGFSTLRISGALLEVLNINENQHIVKKQEILNHLKGNLPWHHSNKPHLHLNQSNRWWEYVEGVFTYVFERLGFSAKAKIYAHEARKLYSSPVNYKLFTDSINVLENFKMRGWRQAIVSNHIPELPEIVDSLELGTYMEFVISSANIGYEKPNEMIYNSAKKMSGSPQEMWMIGDDVIADVIGAENAGINAILVHNYDMRARYHSDSLKDITNIIS
ncbi:MAG TPA: HAD-IA family hydrolase [Methylomusa anaerophila]|uniref:Phosphoglycolate phosphatase n=1 Tax=Methylomusa anaerophila TaxID=1930071 RepID=A0A348AER3_9FIRM|nr:HAD-IA family hydrolase [Methylomusa anaerophila]BBB89561.1 phosphoglycolate phosphatase [Methylomusa anaerophila]HML90071.1 HAD-IA family hydrolase [Methylomusa anaerophila]